MIAHFAKVLVISLFLSIPALAEAEAEFHQPPPCQEPTCHSLHQQVRTPAHTPEGLHLRSNGGVFDSSRNTLIFFNGWNSEGERGQYASVFQSDDPVSGPWIENGWEAGFNVFSFDWHIMSWDDGFDCLGAGWLGNRNEPCRAQQDLFKSGGAVDAFMAAYKSQFQPLRESYQGKEIRMVTHSLGAQIAITASYRFYRNPIKTGGNTLPLPNRIDLIDPWVGSALSMVGCPRGENKCNWIPPEKSLPLDFRVQYRPRIWFLGSHCWGDPRGPFTGNSDSIYCVVEGMAYDLRQAHNVGLLDFSSISGGFSANDFGKFMHFQGYAGGAFNGDSEARHGIPVSAYFYSFAEPEPDNGFSANTPLGVLRQTNQRRLQTAGLNTLSFLDDEIQTCQPDDC